MPTGRGEQGSQSVDEPPLPPGHSLLERCRSPYQRDERACRALHRHGEHAPKVLRQGESADCEQREEHPDKGQRALQRALSHDAVNVHVLLGLLEAVDMAHSHHAPALPQPGHVAVGKARELVL